MVGSSLTKKGQVTIPKEIRELLGLKEHDRVLFIHQGEKVVLKPLKGNLLDLKGSVVPKNYPEDFNIIRKKVKKEIVARRSARE
ncbi:MAG: AbrB/MazE/SpoVT family DNA-binding domain-containing protein [Bacteroidetes bacterium]|nr:AbrB/MazE/SpoVT family DNA-binding domain-containing protein [Bacteroidota bacterium]